MNIKKFMLVVAQTFFIVGIIYFILNLLKYNPSFLPIIWVCIFLGWIFTFIMYKTK